LVLNANSLTRASLNHFVTLDTRLAEEYGRLLPEASFEVSNLSSRPTGRERESKQRTGLPLVARRPYRTPWTEACEAQAAR
jgi:hypothetical protein